MKKRRRYHAYRNTSLSITATDSSYQSLSEVEPPQLSWIVQRSFVNSRSSSRSIPHPSIAACILLFEHVSANAAYFSNNPDIIPVFDRDAMPLIDPMTESEGAVMLLLFMALSSHKNDGNEVGSGFAKTWYLGRESVSPAGKW